MCQSDVFMGYFLFWLPITASATIMLVVPLLLLLHSVQYFSSIMTRCSLVCQLTIEMRRNFEGCRCNGTLAGYKSFLSVRLSINISCESGNCQTELINESICHKILEF